MNKKWQWFVIFTLVFVLIASGCSSKKGESEVKEEDGDNEVAAGGMFPIVKNKTTLKFLVRQDSMIIDFNTNEFVKWYEDKTNIHIDWEVIPSDSVTEKVNLILSTGDLPDAFFGVGINEEQYAVQQQMFLPIDGMIEKYAPNFHQVLQKHDVLRGLITATDGHIYGLPSWNDCYHCSMAQKLWINKKWLDELGLEEPKTTDEFYSVLKAFKERDPNGNNKPDEIPFAGAVDGWHSDPNNFIMNAFTYTNSMYNALKLIVKDGKVETIVNTPAYREGLQYIHRLYKEGLLYNPSYTQKNDQLRQLVANPDAEILGAFVSGANVNIIDAASNPERYKNYVALAPLEGPQGVRYATHFKYDAAAPGSFYIPATSKNPEAALRWADYFYSHEGGAMKGMGLKGKGWDDPQAGDVGLNGEPALLRRLVPYIEEPQNDSLWQYGINYAPEEYRFGEAMDPNVDLYSVEGLEKLLLQETRNKYEPYIPKDDSLSVIPPIKLKDEESQQIQTISVELSNYVKESTVRFVTGDLSLERDWDKYVESLNKIGLEKYLETYQKGYDRQYKN